MSSPGFAFFCRIQYIYCSDRGCLQFCFLALFPEALLGPAVPISEDTVHMRKKYGVNKFSLRKTLPHASMRHAVDGVRQKIWTCFIRLGFSVHFDYTTLHKRVYVLFSGQLRCRGSLFRAPVCALWQTCASQPQSFERWSQPVVTT